MLCGCNSHRHERCREVGLFEAQEVACGAPVELHEVAFVDAALHLRHAEGAHAVVPSQAVVRSEHGPDQRVRRSCARIRLARRLAQSHQVVEQESRWVPADEARLEEAGELVPPPLSTFAALVLGADPSYTGVPALRRDEGDRLGLSKRRAKLPEEADVLRNEGYFIDS